MMMMRTTLMTIAVVVVTLTLLAMGVAGSTCTQYEISTTGPAGDPEHQAFTPSSCYNSDRNEVLVVWTADKIDTAFEVYGQLLSASGAQIGFDDFQVSRAGDDPMDTQYDAMSPMCAYNPDEKEYMVVYQADMEGQNNGFEIYATRVSDEGRVLGETIQVSETDPTNIDFIAALPKVIYNDVAKTYFVSWEADQIPTRHAVEVWGRLVTSSGIMSSIERLSYMGADDTDTLLNAVNSDSCFNSVDNQYLVVWQGDNETHLAFEAVGQFVDGSTGLKIGRNFQISDMGVDPKSTSFRAFRPKCAHNPIDNVYLVVWYGDTDRVGANGALNIYGQMLSGAGAKVSIPSFPISQMGESPFDPTYDGVHPRLVHNRDANEFLVAFEGDVPPGDDANEAFVQRVAGSQADLLGPRKQVSQTGADPTDSDYVVQKVTPLYVAADQTYVLVWGADAQGAPKAYEVTAAWINTEGDLLAGNFCASASPAEESNTTTITVVVLILLLVIIAAVVGVVYYKHRANKKQNAAEARAAQALKHAEAESRGKAKVGETGASDKGSKPKAKSTRPPGSRKVKVSRKRKSRKPPTKKNDTQGLLPEDPSYSYVSYSTYTYEWDDEVEADRVGAQAPAGDDGFTFSDSDVYSDEQR